MLRFLLWFFSSVWVGVVLLVLLFVYCSIGSAMPFVRQHPLLEMTEFQWFHWWPFNVLIVLFCASLTVTTIRRIPLRSVNAGVWMIHAGIIILCIGSYHYFGTKVEGDAIVYRRQVNIGVPGVSQTASMLAVPGARATVGDATQQWQFRVQSTNSAWPILSDEHKGEKAYAVNVAVTSPTGEQYIRQLLAGYPQYTEDVIPGQGRAIKSLGRRLIDENLRLELAYEPQDYFHVMQSWALYVRRVGETEWKQRPLHGLPRYNDHIASRDQVFLAPHDHTPIRPIDLEVSPAESGDALDAAEVRITGYLRYARFQQQWSDGGDRLNPVLQLDVQANTGERQTVEFVAFDSQHSQSEGGFARFVWLDDASQIASLVAGSRAAVSIAIPDTNIAFDVNLTGATVVGREGPFTPIEGTDLSYRIVGIHDNLALDGGRKSVSVALVEVKTPDGQFTRMVADDPAMTRDMPADDTNPHTAPPGEQASVDPRIQIAYQPRSAPLTLAAYPGGLFLSYAGADGQSLSREIAVGEDVEIPGGLKLRVAQLLTHASLEQKPAVVPPESRQRDAGESFAMVCVEVDAGTGIQRKWIPYNQYVLPNDQYAYSGRLAYTPRRFKLKDGSTVEIVFSRERRKLPAPVGLDGFELDTHIGGYTGQAITIRNYLSNLSFWGPDGWTSPVQISVNAPTEHSGYWYFQSIWDKPPANDPAGGMNYTGLGIGNRHGVFTQLIGCCISVIGMIFAFYVKPIIKRRQLAHVRVGEAVTATEPDESPVIGALQPEREPSDVDYETISNSTH